MGFDDNAFRSSLTINPDAAGNVQVDESGYQSWKALADESARWASDLFRQADEEDAALGTQIGKGAISLGPNGKVIRSPIPPEINSKAGRTAFLREQRVADFNQRSLAVRDMGKKLVVQYQNDPTGTAKFIEDFKVYSDAVMEDAHPDIKSQLDVYRFNIGRQHALKLADLATKREHGENTQAAEASATSLLSDILEKMANGRNPAGEIYQLKKGLQAAVAAGFMGKTRAAELNRQGNISEATGRFIRQAMKGVHGKDLADISANLKKEIYKDDKEGVFGSKVTSSIEAITSAKDPVNLPHRPGDQEVNITMKDRDAVWAKVEAVIQTMQKAYNNAQGQANIQYGAIIANVNEVVSKINPEDQTRARMEEVLTNAGLTLEVARINAMVRAFRIQLLERGQSQSAKDRRRAERVIINRMETELIQPQKPIAEYDEQSPEGGIIGYTDSMAEWLRNFEAQKGTQLFKYNVNAELALEKAYVKRVGELVTQGKKYANLSFLDQFNRLAFKDLLNKRIVNIMAVENSPRGRWLLENKGKVFTMIEHNQGENRIITSALETIQSAAGTRASITAADSLLKIQKEDARIKGKNPYDPTTEDGIANLINFAEQSGVVPSALANHLEAASKSRNVDIVRGFVRIYETMEKSPQRASLMESMPAAIKQRMSFLQEHFSSVTGNDQTAFDKFLERLNANPDKELAYRMEKARKETEEIVVDGKLVSPIRDLIAKDFDVATSRDEGHSSFLNTFWKMLVGFRRNTNTEQIQRKDADGNSSTFFGNKVAELEGVSLRRFNRHYELIRPHYSDDTYGGTTARDETWKALIENRVLGPTNYFPNLRRDAEGAPDRRDRSETHIYPRAIESYFPEGVGDVLVEDTLRTHYAIMDATTKAKIPEDVRYFLTGRITGRGLAIEGGSVPRITFENLRNKGYFVLVPREDWTNKDQVTYSVFIANPETKDPTWRPILINDEFRPSQKRYNVIQEEKRLKGYNDTLKGDEGDVPWIEAPLGGEGPL
jgi:hypothetical protein